MRDMHVHHTSVGLAGVFALALGAGALACGSADTTPLTLDEDGATGSALTTNVTIGTVLVVTRRTPLKDDPNGGDTIRRLDVGEQLIALSVSPTNGYYLVKTVDDDLEGYAKGENAGDAYAKPMGDFYASCMDETAI